jgi:hypothetical protein
LDISAPVEFAFYAGNFMAYFLFGSYYQQECVVDKMRAIEVVVIVGIVLAFYALIGKTSTYDFLPTPNLTDFDEVSSEANRVFGAALALISGDSLGLNQGQVSNVNCEDAMLESYINDKLVILRLDDVQAFAWEDISMRITDDSLARHIPITLGVIPKDIEKDAALVEYLRASSDSREVEIAQHGTTHELEEYGKVSREEALQIAGSGKDRLVSTLGVDPITFIPPQNVYNENTTLALQELGFSVISAGHNEYEYESHPKRIGYTASTIDALSEGQPGSLVSPDEILDSCDEAFHTVDVCVIMIHPQDYSSESGSLDEAKYVYFTNLLDRLEIGEYSFFTFRDLIACSQEAPETSLQGTVNAFFASRETTSS